MKPSIAKLFITAAFCLSLGPVAAADLDLAGDIKAQAAKLVKVENPEVLPTIKRVSLPASWSMSSAS